MPNESSINSFEFNHLPVLANNLVESTKILPENMLEGGLMIDATLGGGGHSGLILNAHQKLHAIGLDLDPYAREAANEHLLKFGSRVEIINSNFADFTPKEKAVLVIADLGVSSPQLDKGERGFSFRLDGPIDMRMNPSQGLTAADIIKSLDENQLADIIYNYGEEKFSRRIAKKIKQDINQRGESLRTKELAYSIAGCYPPKMRYGKIHPATRTFQALRIAVNNELENLKKLLEIAPNWLKSNGLICIISFHSLEDRLIKIAFNNDERLDRINKKPIIASEEEIKLNPRSRSAKLRLAKRSINPRKVGTKYQ